MNYPFYLAGRLSLGNNGKHTSPSVSVAIAAVAVSIAVMIASIAIVLGFKREIREKVIGFNGHISLFRYPLNEEDDNIITITPFLENEFKKFRFITDYNAQAAIPAILKTPEDFKGVYLRAVNGKKEREYLEKNLEQGVIPEFTKDEDINSIVVSRKAANQLMINLGDIIETYFISDDVRVRKLLISGIYNSHFDQYDDVLIFGSMDLLKHFGALPDNSGTYVVIQTDDFNKIPDYTRIIQNRLNEAFQNGETEAFYRTDNVMSQGRGFFSWLSLLDTNVTVIIFLMMVVGCITLISGMLIIILERKKFIGLMRALGARTSKIRNVFIFMALRIAVIGIAIGDIVILILLYCQQRFHFLHLDADAYYIDFVPVYLPGWIVVALNSAVLIVTYLILVLPSRFVAKISPAESIIRND